MKKRWQPDWSVAGAPAVTRKGDSGDTAGRKNTVEHWRLVGRDDASCWWVHEAGASGFGDATGGAVRARDRADSTLLRSLPRLHPVPGRSRPSVEMTEWRRIGCGCWLNDADAG